MRPLHYADECFYYFFWRNKVLIAFGTPSLCTFLSNFTLWVMLFVLCCLSFLLRHLKYRAKYTGKVSKHHWLQQNDFGQIFRGAERASGSFLVVISWHFYSFYSVRSHAKVLRTTRVHSQLSRRVSSVATSPTKTKTKGIQLENDTNSLRSFRSLTFTDAYPWNPSHALVWIGSHNFSHYPHF